MLPSPSSRGNKIAVGPIDREFRLAEETGKDPYELERRLGHRSQRYIARYTNPPEHVAAGFAEDL